MAQRTLSVLTHPSFPQVFAAAISAEVNRVCFPVPPTQLTVSICCYETRETSWGACDGQVCRNVASITDVATGLDYCAAHHREVSRG